jgi:S-adenosyl-L-methionine hydrolase (adenosine-forming)
MAIFLFTDFGAADIYPGQMRAAVESYAQGTTVIDLLHDAPPFDIEAGAHLLAALSRQLPERSITVAVVDPGVGSARAPVCVTADDRWFVGPDNGLISVVAARAARVQCFEITWRPPHLSVSFHGRDLFAPCAAMLAAGNIDACSLVPRTTLNADMGAGDCARVIYIDHYGNAVTGIRAAKLPSAARVLLSGHAVPRARVFSDVAVGEPFWYENSLGLVEIAVNRAHAAKQLQLAVGSEIVLETP